jgi:hypothetical protein
MNSPNSPPFFNLVLNQFFKDLRHQRWLIAGWFVFLVIHMLEQWHGGLPEAWAAMDFVFETGAQILVFPITWFLVAEVFFSDAPMPLAPFWKSRPLGAGGVLLAKLCFVVVVLLLPLVINQCVAMQCAEASWSATGLHCMAVVLLVGLWSVLVATVASIAGDWPRFLLGTVFFAISPFAFGIIFGWSDLPHGINDVAVGVLLSFLVLPLAWWLRRRFRTVVWWLGGTMCCILVVMLVSAMRPAPLFKPQPYSPACGYTDFEMHPQVHNSKPTLRYRCQPTWLAEGEERTASLQKTLPDSGTARSGNSRFTPRFESPLATVGHSHNPDIVDDNQMFYRLPRMPLPASPEVLTELNTGYSFETIYSNSPQGFGSHSPGDTCHTMLSVQRQRSAFLISVPLDHPGIYFSRGFTIRVINPKNELPSVRVSHPDIFSGNGLNTFGPLATPLYFKGKDGHLMAIGFDGKLHSAHYLVLEKIGRDAPLGNENRPHQPLPAGELQLFTTLHLSVEYYALDIPVGDPLPHP